jgi:hypothetical protein
MTGAIILNEDWSEYNRKKAANNEDISLFNCGQEWEVQYLIDMLHKRFEFLLSDITLIKAVTATCEETGHPVSRERFVDDVMLKLIS